VFVALSSEVIYEPQHQAKAWPCIPCLVIVNGLSHSVVGGPTKGGSNGGRDNPAQQGISQQN
jgi:hypothetical protein